MKRLPEATWHGAASQGLAFAVPATDHPKGCLHTTEGGDWPTYFDWKVAPHLTVKPIRGVGVEVRQHVEFDTASFALRNLAGGVETNRERVYQIELVGTCDPNGPKSAYFWPEADAAVLRDLYLKVIEPMSRSIADGGLGVGLARQTFQAYDASYGPRGNTNRVRLTGSQWESFSGWLGHQHVPENVHGDPGAFPWAKMIREGTMTEITNLTTAAKADVQAALHAELTLNQITDRSDPTGPKFDVLSILGNTEDDVDKALERLGELSDALTALAAKVAKIPTSASTVTAAQLDTIVTRVTAGLLAGLTDAVLDEAGARLKTTPPAAT